MNYFSRILICSVVGVLGVGLALALGVKSQAATGFIGFVAVYIAWKLMARRSQSNPEPER